MNSPSPAATLSAWRDRLPELESLAQPVLCASAFRRLENITFLGVLSPRFAGQVDSPLFRTEQGPFADDGSRHTHSLGVALIALDLARRFGLSATTQRYAVAWGLIHDIATWPLSHTTEPAFRSIFDLTTRQLRTMMVRGSEGLPERFCLARSLREMGLDPDVLLALFERRAELPDRELAILKQVVNSPLTPDTLEGIWRSGMSFGVDVPSPAIVQLALSWNGSQVVVHQREWPIVVDFWQQKSGVYSRFINRPDVWQWESAWALAIRRDFGKVGLSDSLELTEDEIIKVVQERGLPLQGAMLRFQEPQTYFVEPDEDVSTVDQPVHELWRFLRKQPVGS